MSTLIGNDGTNFSLYKSKIYTEDGWMPAGLQIKQDITVIEGEELNFSVVGGTTEPSSPMENMIWVNTDAEITGWVFQTTVPENPTEGLMWFNTNISAVTPFNALKQNGIYLYPTNSTQYVNGAWVGKIAKTYQNNIWIPWRFYLYNYGPQNINFSQFGTVCPFVIGDTNITWTYPSYVDGETNLFTTDTIDITRYSTANVICAITGGHNNTSIRSINLWVGPDRTSKTAQVSASSGKGTLDISNLTGNYRLGLHAQYSAGYVTQWWLE